MSLRKIEPLPFHKKGMQSLIQEFWDGPWPPTQEFIARMKRAERNTYIDEIIRSSEFAHRLIHAVNDALYVIERASKEMNDDTYLCLIDGMHSLAMVGERKSHLYKEMSLLAHRAMHRMKYY